MMSKLGAKKWEAQIWISQVGRSPEIQNCWLPREKEKEAKGKGRYFGGGRESAVRDSTLKFQSTIRRHQESLLQASSIRRVSTRGNRTKERGYGETIYPKFASSRSATGYTLICPRGNLSTATLLQRRFHHHHHHHYYYHHHLFVRPLQPRSTVPPFPHSLTSTAAFFSRDEENAKPRSLMGILNTDDSALVLFPRHPFSLSAPPPSLDSFPIAFFTLVLLFLPSVDGIRWRYRVRGTMRLQLNLFDIAALFFS